MKRLQMPALAVAVFLLLALLPGAAVRAAQEKQDSNQPAQKQDRHARGPKDMAGGQIQTVACKGRSMDTTFDDSYEILRLRTGNYFKVNFSTINFTPSGTLNPCKTAQRMYARVYYYPIKGQPQVGEMISVELRK